MNNEKTYIITDRKGTRYLYDIDEDKKWDSKSCTYVPQVRITWTDYPKDARTFNKEQLDKTLITLVGKAIAFREAVMFTYYSVWWYNGQINEVQMPVSTPPAGFYKTKGEAARSGLQKLAEAIGTDEVALNERKANYAKLREYAEAEPAAIEQQS